MSSVLIFILHLITHMESSSFRAMNSRFILINMLDVDPENIKQTFCYCLPEIMCFFICITVGILTIIIVIIAIIVDAVGVVITDVTIISFHNLYCY